MKKNIVKRIIFYILLLSIVSVIILSNKTKERMYSGTYTSYLDTVCEITIASKTDAPFNECKDYLAFADKEFSAEDEDSTLYDFNHYQKKPASDDLLTLISIGKEFSDKYPEFFSIYLNETINLWNISESPEALPSDIDIQKTLKNKKINLGGIAKGFITDRLVDNLHKNEVNSALINLGGNTYAMGRKPSGENWKIGVQDPKDETAIVGYITAENIAVITSGDYQRYAEIDGKRYHHILDPKTGYPANSDIHSVTVICTDATTADALSTTAFVAGIEEGNGILKENNAMGIFITDDTVYISKGLEDIFTQEDTSYKYEFLN